MDFQPPGATGAAPGIKSRGETPALAGSPLAPEESLRFFRQKGLGLSFDWRDVWQEEHGAAFVVAKAMRVDILEDIREALDKAQTRGLTFQEFKRNLAPILQSKGWWGRKDMVDPATGQTVSAQLGSDRRLRIIFDTNLRMAEAAGRWERIERTAEARPFLRYVAIRDGRTRPEHMGFHGTVRPVGDAWWSTHYPPNGWRCRCTVQQLSAADLTRFGYQVSPEPKVSTRPWTNKRTGEVLRVPEGIDPGFAYNVGKSRYRALTPPPSGGLPTSFPPGTALPPLPDPSPFPASQVLPQGGADADYVKAFLADFGARPGKPTIFTDKIGEPLVISDDLFRSPDGTVKVRKRGRGPLMRMLAATLKDPDEIWWIWEESRTKPGTWLLRRRYIGRWSVAGTQETGLAVFDCNQDGWTGVTALAPSPADRRRQDRYIYGLRAGTLAWRRKD
jgi:SPP1 gp7 family putative phage head morphogenesis protein